MKMSMEHFIVGDIESSNVIKELGKKRQTSLITNKKMQNIKENIEIQRNNMK